MRGYLFIAVVLGISMIVVSNIKAASIELFSGVSSYNGYVSLNRSASLITELGNGYDYALTMSKEVNYSKTDITGSLEVVNSVEVNQFSMSVRRKFNYENIFAATELGVGLSIVDATTSARYNNEGTLESEYIPIDVSLTFRQSKSYVLPFAGLMAGMYLHDNFYVYVRYKYNGYNVKGMGLGVDF